MGSKQRRRGEAVVQRGNTLLLMPYHGLGAVGLRYSITCDEDGVITLTPVDPEASWIYLDQPPRLREAMPEPRGELALDVTTSRG